MMKKLRNEKGVLTLEASIVVVLFIFLMLFLYSFFVVFEARNRMAHAVLATTNSLALDAYQNQTFGKDDTVGGVLYKLYGAITNENNDFTDTTNWHLANADGTPQNAEVFTKVIKDRFLAYLSGGDKEKAARILKHYHIENGIEGLDFSESYVANGDLHIILRYKLDYEYNTFGQELVEFKQSACSKLWSPGS